MASPNPMNPNPESNNRPTRQKMVFAACVVAIAIATGLAAMAGVNWYYRGETLAYESVPGSGDGRMAAQIDRDLQEVVREERIDPRAFCLRIPLWAQSYQHGCVLARAALVARRRQCTPYRQQSGGCYAVEVNAALLNNISVRQHVFAHGGNLCLYTSSPAPNVGPGASSIDCVSPGAEYKLVRRINPLLCVVAVDSNERVSRAATAVFRGQVVQDYWCREWEKLARARERAQPHDCWLGVSRPLPGGGSFTGCDRY